MGGDDLEQSVPEWRTAGRSLGLGGLGGQRLDSQKHVPQGERLTPLSALCSLAEHVLGLLPLMPLIFLLSKGRGGPRRSALASTDFRSVNSLVLFHCICFFVCLLLTAQASVFPFTTVMAGVLVTSILQKVNRLEEKW